jgi:broad specificity phosphatase PhoE
MTDDTTSRGHITVHNTANGPVGMQAGTISNSTVWQNVATRAHDTTDFIAELSALRADLERERSRGHLDDDTYDAARGELDIADKALASTTPEGKKTFVLALKRLGGLIAELTGLAAKIAALVAAAKGMP